MSGLHRSPPPPGNPFLTCPSHHTGQRWAGEECVSSDLRLSSCSTLGSSLVPVLTFVHYENFKHTQMLRESRTLGVSITQLTVNNTGLFSLRPRGPSSLHFLEVC